MELRDSFFNNLLEKAKTDKNIILLTADMGAHALAKFKEQVSTQFINVGIAEQNMISVAAGLALEGKQVYCYAISSFLILRALEQIKIDVCNMETNVTLIGVGGGIDYSYDGSTHHCTNDIGVLNTLPNMKIYAPFDEETIKWSLDLSGPLYIRLPKGDVGNLYKEQLRPNLFRIKNGRRFILTYGMVVHKIMSILDKLGASDVGVLAFTQLKPINNIGDLKYLLKDVSLIVEQHSIQGGLRSILGQNALYQEYQKYWGYLDMFVDIGGSIDYVEEYASTIDSSLEKMILRIQDED